jgi:hypothetical protein
MCIYQGYAEIKSISSFMHHLFVTIMKVIKLPLSEKNQSIAMHVILS